MGASTAGRPEGASPAQGAQEERATTPAEGPGRARRLSHIPASLLIDSRIKGLKNKPSFYIMPSVNRSDMWFFRVTVPHTVAESEIVKILQWRTPFGDEVVSFLAATHIGKKGENEHFHAIIKLTTQLQKQSFDVRIKKLYGVSGNEYYSSKPWDGSDAACSYLFHEESARIIANRGYSDEDIERFKKLNADVQKVVAVNAERASHKHVEKVIEKIKLSGHSWSQRMIFDEFVRRIYNREMYDPGDYQLKKYIEEVSILQCEDDIQLNAYSDERYYRLYKT